MPSPTSHSAPNRRIINQHEPQTLYRNLKCIPIEVQGWSTLPKTPRIKFTKHAHRKFELLKHYGFEITENQVTDTISNPTRIEQRDNQYLATKPTNTKHALRVIYEKRKDYLLVITFYPVRRERYDI